MPTTETKDAHMEEGKKEGKEGGCTKSPWGPLQRLGLRSENTIYFQKKP